VKEDGEIDSNIESTNEVVAAEKDGPVNDLQT